MQSFTSTVHLQKVRSADQSCKIDALILDLHLQMGLATNKDVMAIISDAKTTVPSLAGSSSKAAVYKHTVIT